MKDSSSNNNVSKKKNSKKLNLEQELVRQNDSILGIKVQSVVLPDKYKSEIKTEQDMVQWLEKQKPKEEQS